MWRLWLKSRPTETKTVMELKRFELSTSALRTQRSPN
jgi:hypothetical protein